MVHFARFYSKFCSLLLDNLYAYIRWINCCPDWVLLVKILGAAWRRSCRFRWSSLCSFYALWSQYFCNISLFSSLFFRALIFFTQISCQNVLCEKFRTTFIYKIFHFKLMSNYFWCDFSHFYLCNPLQKMWICHLGVAKSCIFWVILRFFLTLQHSRKL